MNGRQLNGLCKVLNVFQDTVLMDYPVVIDDILRYRLSDEDVLGGRMVRLHGDDCSES